jgi:hypothetical protein
VAASRPSRKSFTGFCSAREATPTRQAFLEAGPVYGPKRLAIPALLVEIEAAAMR